MNARYVIVTTGRSRHVLPEGPWDTIESAQQYLDSEVGVPASIERMLFAQRGYVYVRSERGQQWLSPNGEGFTARRIKIMSGWVYDICRDEFTGNTR